MCVPLEGLCLLPAFLLDLCHGQGAGSQHGALFGCWDDVPLAKSPQHNFLNDFLHMDSLCQPQVLSSSICNHFHLAF